MIRPAMIVRTAVTRKRLHVRETFLSRGVPTALLDILDRSPDAPNAMLVPIERLRIDEEETAALEARWGDPVELEAYRVQHDHLGG
jgi:hypothetical protein